MKAVEPELRLLETLLAAEREIERSQAEIRLAPEEELEPEITLEPDLGGGIEIE